MPGYSIGDYSIGDVSIGGSSPVTTTAPFDPAGQKCGSRIQPAPCCCCQEYVQVFGDDFEFEGWTQDAGEWYLAGSGQIATGDANAILSVEPFGEYIDCAYWKIEVLARGPNDFAPINGATWQLWIGEPTDRLIAEMHAETLNGWGPHLRWWTRIIRETTAGREVLAQQLHYAPEILREHYLCVVPTDAEVWTARTNGISVDITPIRSSRVGLGTYTLAPTSNTSFATFRAYIKATDQPDTACTCEETDPTEVCMPCSDVAGFDRDLTVHEPDEYQITLASMGDLSSLEGSYVVERCTLEGADCSAGYVYPSVPCNYWLAIDEELSCGDETLTVLGIGLQFKPAGVLVFLLGTQTDGMSADVEVTIEWFAPFGFYVTSPTFDCLEGGMVAFSGNSPALDCSVGTPTCTVTVPA